MMELCNKKIFRKGMSESRGCLKKIRHFGPCTPDLTNMENALGYKKILKRGPDYVLANKKGNTKVIRWFCLGTHGDEYLVRNADLFKNDNKGINAGKNSILRVTNKHGKTKPEYLTIYGHWSYIFTKKSEKNPSYTKMRFYDAWNPNFGGSFKEGVKWMEENMPKPSSDHQLHVIKSKEHPFGFFGPGGIVWRHKSDRHDNDIIDLIYNMPKEKLYGLYKEIERLLQTSHE